jgi:cephalosporin-C deacetylase-like acetyl esterase
MRSLEIQAAAVIGGYSPTALPKQDHIYNQWSLNKTESISMTYDAVREQRIRGLLLRPCGACL